MKVALPWDKLEKLQRPHKLGIFVGTLLVLGAAFYYGLFQPLQNDINTVNEEIDKVETEIKTLQFKSANLRNIEKRLKELEDDFREASKRLPEDQEIPGLMKLVAGQARLSNLEILFWRDVQEAAPSSDDIYTEISVSLGVEGFYRDVAQFFDLVAKLTRIVNINNITMNKLRLEEGEMLLTTNCTATTFRFLTEEEIAAAQKAAVAAGGKKRR